MPARINKFLVAVAGTCGVLAAALADGQVSNVELGTIVSSVIGTILVYVVPNHPTPPQA